MRKSDQFINRRQGPGEATARRFDAQGMLRLRRVAVVAERAARRGRPANGESGANGRSTQSDLSAD